MKDLIFKQGLAGGVGFLIGLALMTWIEPLTIGGKFLLIVICIVSVIVVTELVGFVKSFFQTNKEHLKK